MAKTKGLVIKEQTVGESDRLVTLLTADYGLVNAFVRGAKQLKNRLAASTSHFCIQRIFNLSGPKTLMLLTALILLKLFLI